MNTDDMHSKMLREILENQKVMADALEFFVMKKWQFNMERQSHEMLTKLREINGRKTKPWRSQ